MLVTSKGKTTTTKELIEGSIGIEKYGSQIALYAAAVFFNAFAGVYVAARKLFLKDTGRKLAHIEKQLRTGESISEELSRRLSEE